MKTIFSISIFTLIALLSINFQNFRSQVKLKSNESVAETEVVRLITAELTDIVLAFICPVITLRPSYTPTLIVLSTENPTVNQLYLALPPPVFS